MPTTLHLGSMVKRLAPGRRVELDRLMRTAGWSLETRVRRLLLRHHKEYRHLVSPGVYSLSNCQAIRFLLNCRVVLTEAIARICEGVMPNSRRKASLKWLWLENPRSRATRARSPSPINSSDMRNLRRVRYRWIE